MTPTLSPARSNAWSKHWQRTSAPAEPVEDPPPGGGATGPGGDGAPPPHWPPATMKIAAPRTTSARIPPKIASTLFMTTPALVPPTILSYPKTSDRGNARPPRRRETTAGGDVKGKFPGRDPPLPPAFSPLLEAHSRSRYGSIAHTPIMPQQRPFWRYIDCGNLRAVLDTDRIAK